MKKSQRLKLAEAHEQAALGALHDFVHARPSDHNTIQLAINVLTDICVENNRPELGKIIYDTCDFALVTTTLDVFDMKCRKWPNKPYGVCQRRQRVTEVVNMYALRLFRRRRAGLCTPEGAYDREGIWRPSAAEEACDLYRRMLTGQHDSYLKAARRRYHCKALVERQALGYEVPPSAVQPTLRNVQHVVLAALTAP